MDIRNLPPVAVKIAQQKRLPVGRVSNLFDGRYAELITPGLQFFVCVGKGGWRFDCHRITLQRCEIFAVLFRDFEADHLPRS